VTTDQRLPATTPSPRRLGRVIGQAFDLAVKVSAPVAAVFGILAWNEARISGPDQAVVARNTITMVDIATRSLDREEERQVLDRAMLASLERLLPEAERTRLGVEQLAKLLDGRIDAVREQRRRLKAAALPRPAPAATKWWSPDSPSSRKAKEIFDKIDKQ